jgi:hypothetical protein
MYAFEIAIAYRDRILADVESLPSGERVDFAKTKVREAIGQLE